MNVMPYRPVEPPLFAHVSPLAVKKLVELDPTPHLLIDVRHPDSYRMEPKLFENCINIPGTFCPQSWIWLYLILEKSATSP